MGSEIHAGLDDLIRGIHDAIVATPEAKPGVIVAALSMCLASAFMGCEQVNMTDANIAQLAEAAIKAMGDRAAKIPRRPTRGD